MDIRARLVIAALAVALSGVQARAQVGTNVPPLVAGAKPVSIQRIKVHSSAIQGNLSGEAADREVLVVLPPGYVADRAKRYPVVYALHGYSIGAEQWSHEIHLPQTVEGAFANGAREMIIVLPDSKTAYGGSMYSRSVTTGDFETFIARDLVAYIDAHYRTIANRGSRGLAGHSMGGYGVARIGMAHPDVFGALYLMSPGLNIHPGAPLDAKGQAAIDALRKPADAADLPFPLKAQLAVSAAWSPNPAKPPLYLDLPHKGGAPLSEVLAKWDANAPLASIDQHVGDLRRYRAIAMDVGDEDTLKTVTQQFHEALDSYRIANTFELYSGTHTSNVAFRFQDHVIPFFSRALEFQTAR
jgi:S-formylglutathione hydrolase FrmB